ncbi:hypothetical protein WA1_37820 [Scytonema hofmannii PCC 7110]|uniref:Uncharacterized protein n=1 Tax=Scytonema hofmannii PCC 7110 TaxID=128403 RepID=A0A139X0G2_9CYAN|nr:hypothetical protein [Scytonema hofmannii]KYC38112.1 hypothetical protein WA1_37820 [Scytonema hofmannii PCC 7110]
MNQNSRALQIRNPSLTLFAFHLRHTLNEDSNQVKENAEHLWEQCVELGQQLNLDPIASLKSKLVCYEGNPGVYNPTLEQKALEQKHYNKHSSLPLNLLEQTPILKFQVPTSLNSPECWGEIYPLRIHDTYAVDFTLRYKELVDIKLLNQLNPNGYFLSSWMRPSLGETLLLFAESLNDSDDYQTLANDCVEALLSETIASQVSCVAQGKLFGNPIFEYENKQEAPTQHIHLWVWLKPPSNSIDLPKETNFLLNLLMCRSKILFAYHQARQCYSVARQLYSQLEEKAQIFNNLPTDSARRLEKLKELLSTLSSLGFKYARTLRDMVDSDSSILTNRTNYNTWLSKIDQKSQEKFDDDDLKFLKNFYNRTCLRLHKQIQTDLKYLSPGQNMFQQAIALSRGIVELDQAERDDQQEKLEKERERNFQTTVFAVGAGLSVGGIVISASSQVTKENPIRLPLSPTFSVPPHPFILWVFGSIISGLVAAWITWYVTKYWQKHSANG